MSFSENVQMFSGINYPDFIFADKPENSVYVIKWEFMYQLIFHPQMTQIAQILFFLRKRYFPALSCALHLRCIVIRVICVICG